MRRVHTVPLSATTRETSPPSVWAMTMTVIGAAFGAGSLARSGVSGRTNTRRAVR